MQNQRQLNTAVALVLALSLPAVTGARLGLDASMRFDPGSHVETVHGPCCTWRHDHNLCILTFHTPWSVAPITPWIDVPLPRLLKTLASEPLGRNDIAGRLEVARSPPPLF